VKRFVFLVVMVACGGTLGPSEDAGDDDATADAALDAKYLACFDSSGQTDPSLKVCKTWSDCVVVQHQTDCCGTILYVGVSSTSAASFQKCEGNWDEHFPPCDCASNTRKTEDGHDVAPGDEVGPVADCDAGLCMTQTI